MPPPAIARAWRPAFYADWAEVTMLHLAVEPRLLQPTVPFALDLHEGSAYVSLVAFTMRRMRPAGVPRGLGELLLRPISPCRFLNVRTYVRAGSQAGIYFIAEWLSNWVNIPFGPIAYGLPYRAGWLHYGAGGGEVRSWRGGRLEWETRVEPGGSFAPAEAGSLDAFLLERYLAFTICRGEERVFRVAHEPWPQQRAEAKVGACSLLAEAGPWAPAAECCLAHRSPGVQGVAMGVPERTKRT